MSNMIAVMLCMIALEIVEGVTGLNLRQYIINWFAVATVLFAAWFDILMVMRR